MGKQQWTDVENAVKTAHSIAFDGCHKIYVLMDEGQTNEMVGYGYRQNKPGESQLFQITELPNPVETLREWWADSCPLRFVNAVKTVEGNPNAGFTTLIGQGDDPDEEN